MKSRIFLGFMALFFGSLFSSIAFSATGESVSTESSGSLKNDNLLIESLDITDDMHVALVFNKSVVRESVRIRITRQSDNSNIKIDTLTGSIAGTSVVGIILSDTLEANTTYKLTIVSAISDDGIVIKEGADALKEFTTPVSLKKSQAELSAPSNPNAVVIEQKTSTGTSSGTSSSPLTVTKEVEPVKPPVQEVKPTSTEELPMTGMNTWILLGIALLTASGLIFFRKNA